MKLLWIVNGEINITGQFLIRYSPFCQIMEKVWSAME